MNSKLSTLFMIQYLLRIIYYVLRKINVESAYCRRLLVALSLIVMRSAG